MKMTFSHIAKLCGCAALVLTAGAGSVASAQVIDSLVKAKALYADADYAKALEILGPGDGAETQQYRALCFLALGQLQDAERALEALSTSAPTFSVSDADVPPRLVTLFTQTRRRILPTVVRKLFSEAREDFQAKEFERARGKFEQVMTLTNDPTMALSAETADLQLLTASYLDIVKNAAPSVPAKTAARGFSAAPVVASPPSSAPAAVGSTAVIPAITIRQDVPSFVGAATRPLSGAVRVVIGTDGLVRSAEMEIPIEPRYDARLLTAARTWKYKPAVRGGKPVESEKVIAINVGQR
jgi:hypothetical protein